MANRLLLANGADPVARAWAALAGEIAERRERDRVLRELEAWWLTGTADPRE